MCVLHTYTHHTSYFCNFNICSYVHRSSTKVTCAFVVDVCVRVRVADSVLLCRSQRFCTPQRTMWRWSWTWFSVWRPEKSLWGRYRHKESLRTHLSPSSHTTCWAPHASPAGPLRPSIHCPTHSPTPHTHRLTLLIPPHTPPTTLSHRSRLCLHRSPTCCPTHTPHLILRLPSSDRPCPNLKRS